MHRLHVCECDSVVKVVAVCLLKVASLTKDVSNGGFLQGWKRLNSVQVALMNAYFKCYWKWTGVVQLDTTFV